jgi:hypothetical protein
VVVAALQSHAHRPAPVRGLVFLCNRAGRRLPQADVVRWLRLNRRGFHALKVDVLTPAPDVPVLLALLEEARQTDLKLSLRTDSGAAPPADLHRLRDAGLWDVFLTPETYDAASLDPWLDACRACQLPLRVQFTGKIPEEFAPERTADRMAAAGVPVVHVAVFDPFVRGELYTNAHESAVGVQTMNRFLRALAARAIEANLLRLPFCLADAENRAHVVNSGQFFADHQHYLRDAYDLALRLYARRPLVAGKAVQMLLGRHTSYANPIDARLLPWLLDKPWLRARVWALHKLTRHDRRESHAARDDRAPEVDPRFEPLCAQCSFRFVCDHATRRFVESMPGLAVTPQPGDAPRWPLHLSVTQPKYYDGIDAERAAAAESAADLARIATDIAGNRPPTREITSFAYGTEGQWSHQMHGGVRWHSFTNTEKVSTPLATLELPFTLSATFGGGIAEAIGFSVGRYARIMCPMVAYDHTLVLHAAADGRYVLLRDGYPVVPIAGERGCYVPVRVGTRVEPRLALLNIDETLVTQTVLAWEAPEETAPAPSIDYSVVIVSARYARRLQATLQSLVHQDAFDLRRLEIIVAYVPGIDPTDDVLDSVRALHPELRIVRAPFVEALTRSKGFLINEAAALATGKWVILMDSDILAPPDLFTSMDALPRDCMFAAPNGRKMLPPEVTAQVLLGEVRPWEEWQRLLAGAGEFRYREVDGVPIGYFQAVRRACLDKVRYEEYEHYEGADWGFGKAMRDEYGAETRLSGHPVLHLDHGGSQWYGARKQL